MLIQRLVGARKSNENQGNQTQGSSESRGSARIANKCRATGVDYSTPRRIDEGEDKITMKKPQHIRRLSPGEKVRLNDYVVDHDGVFKYAQNASVNFVIREVEIRPRSKDQDWQIMFFRETDGAGRDLPLPKPPITLKIDGDTKVVIFEKDGSLAIGCVLISSIKFAEIAARRAEVMKS